LWVALGPGLATAAGAPTVKPIFATQASPSITVGAGTISDTATVVGAITFPASPRPTGSVMFSLYGPDDATCANAPVFTTGAIPVNADPNAPTHTSFSSGAFTPTLPGTYRWVASYSGDSFYLPASGGCNGTNESVLVTAVTPTITTMASPSVPVGGSVTDTLTGGMNPTGSIIFRIYQPSDTTCAGPAVGGSTVTITDPSSTVSQPYKPPIAGTFKWKAFYTGDHVNGAVASKCDDPNESVAVTPAPGSGPSSGGGSGGILSGMATPGAACDPAATARAILAGLVATLTGQSGAAFRNNCSAGLRIVLRAKEIRPGNPGQPRRDGFTTMTNILTHISPSEPSLSFSLNANGQALRDYAISHGQSLIGFLVVHLRPDKKSTSTEALQILSLG
jgi:hypothetical protein